MDKQEIKTIFEKRQRYLRWMCENWVDLYESWFWSCLKKLAKDFWLDTDDFWTTDNDEYE